MTIPEQYTYPAAPGGWPPPDGAPQYQQYQQEQYQQEQYQQAQYYQPVPPPRRRRGGRVAAAVGGGVAVLAMVGAGGFAAGWAAHPDALSPAGNAAPYLPFDPGTGGQDGAGGQNGGGQNGGGNGAQGGGNGSGSQGGNGFGSQGGNGFGSPGGGSGSGSGAAGASDSQVAAVAAKVDPALVDINTVLGAQNAEAAGTGIVLTSDGVVLTNNHVVAGATSITVTDIGNHKSYRAAVVGYDRGGDVAVLRLSGASGLATAPLATGTTVRTGDPVVAIGNAGGAGGTPSAVGGAIAALGQSITASDESSGASEQLTGLIEVNADIEAGDSGGPLLTTSGQVIGVDTAASAGFRYQSAGGAGYAIPIGTATTIAGQIRAGQSSSKVHIGETAYLGVETTDSSNGFAGAAGPVVLGVVAGSPAASAGLSRGDVIRSVGGTTVGSATALTEEMDRHHPGDRIKVAWTDLNGTSHSGTIKLATGPVG